MLRQGEASAGRQENLQATCGPLLCREHHKDPPTRGPLLWPYAVGQMGAPTVESPRFPVGSPDVRQTVCAEPRTKFRARARLSHGVAGGA